MYNIGLAYKRANYIDEAIKCFQVVLKLMPNYKKAQDQLDVLLEDDEE